MDESRWYLQIDYLDKTPTETFIYQIHGRNHVILFSLYEYSTYVDYNGQLSSIQIRQNTEERVWKILQAHQRSEYLGDGETDIRTIDINTFPKSEEDVKKAWSLISFEDLTREPTNEEIAATLDGFSGMPMKFRKNESYDVYSGPGKQYIRAADGKARVSTNGPIQVYGAEQDWILISYKTNGGGVRFGYISIDALAEPKKVSKLERYTVGMGKLTEQCAVVDDPIYGGSTVRVLPEDSPIDVLAVYGDWCFIDDSMTNKDSPCRGFVPLPYILFTVNM